MITKPMLGVLTLIIVSNLGLVLAADPNPADSQPTAEQLNSARWWLDRAVIFADQIEVGEDRSEAHYKLTFALARDGDFGRALVAATAVTNPQTQIYSFAFVAKLAHEKGDEETCTKALKIAREIAIPAQIGQTNGHMIRLYYELGRGEEALSFADALPSQTQRLLAISDVAEELAKLGRVEEAMRVVRKYHPPNWIDSRRVAIAKACASKNHFDQAIALAEKVEAIDSRDNAYDRISELLIRAGHLERGKEIAERIDDKLQKSTRLAQHLSASVRSGAGGKSMDEAMKEASSRREKISLGTQQIDQHIKLKEIDPAEALIERLVQVVKESPEEAQTSKFGTFDDSLLIATIRAHYMETARLLKESGDEQAAKQRIDKAFAAAKAINSKGLGKSMLLSRLVQQLSALGDIAGAEALIDLQDSAFTQASSSGDVAARLILNGKVDEGLKKARTAVADRSSAYGTRRVAIALLTVKRYDELAHYMSNMPDAPDEVRAFREIAEEMVKRGHIDRLSGLLDKLPSDAARTQACLGAHDTLKKQ